VEEKVSATVQLELESDCAGCDASTVKTLSIEEAEGHFKAVCEEALAGEVIRLQMANGSLLELTPVPTTAAPLSDEELAGCYEDNEWAVLENRCGTASD
jgi:hypothetical protein